MKAKLPRTLSHVTRRVPTALPAEPVERVRRRIERQADAYTTINYVYVTGKSGELVGVASIRRLLATSSKKTMAEVMTKTVISAHRDTDPEKIAYLALKHNLKAIPIVGQHRVFVGVVPSDVILHILYRETREDLLKSAGIHPNHGESILNMAIPAAFRHRASWIILGLFGGVLMARIIESFSATLGENLILASFIPLVVYTGGAVSAQTQTLYVRDLATEVSLPLPRYIGRQMAVAVLLSLVCSILIWGAVWLIFGSFQLGMVIAASTATGILVASAIGLLIPFTLHRFRQDPADGSGPFATILTDIASVVIYFAVASALTF